MSGSIVPSTTDSCRGFKLAAIKLITASTEHLEKHYADLSDKPFFKGLVTCTFYQGLTRAREE